MRAICKISGLPLYKSPYLIGFDLADIHPIFRAKRKLILTPQMVHNFMRAQAAEEKKLIFLAVMNATELVEWRAVANPSQATCEKYFFKLMHTAGWLAHAEYTYRHIVGFPQFVCDETTSDLLSVGNWITALEDLKDQIIRKDIDRDRAASLSQKEAEIRREIAEATLLHRAFTPTLARWALDFASLPRDDERYNRYIKIMCSPLSEAWLYEIDELRDIEELLSCELPAEHPQVISVMFQVRELIKECRKGFREFAVFNEQDEEGESFVIIDDETGIVTKSKHLIDVPTEEPVQKDYATKAAWLVAKAKFMLSQRNKKQLPSDSNNDAGDLQI